MKRAIAVFFGAGLVPVAPGTAGSLAAAALGLVLLAIGGLPLLLAAAALAILAGFWSLSGTLADPGDDPPSIVIDEVAGQLIALLPAAYWIDRLEPATPAGIAAFWIAAFLLFRVFDIAKPWFIGRADRMRGATGIMLDDIAAGAVAGVLLAAAGGLARYLGMI